MSKRLTRKMPFYRKYPKASMFVITCVLCLLLVFVAEWMLGSDLDFNLIKEGRPRVVSLHEYPPGMHLEVRQTENSDRIELGQKTVGRLRIDQHGFIEPSGLHGKADVSVIFLGGSTTECFWVEEEKRFPCQSAVMAEKITGLKINSYNGGMSGTDLSNSTNVLWNKCLQINPTYVVVMHNINDLMKLWNFNTYWNTPVRPNLVNGLTPENSRYSKLLSLTKGPFPRVRSRVMSIFSKTTQSNDEWAALRDDTSKVDTTSIFRDYQMALTSFIQICRSWDIQPIIMTQANLISGFPLGELKYSTMMNERFKRRGRSYSEFEELYTKFSEIIRKVGRQYEVKVIDLERDIPKEQEYFYDFVHFNTTGSTLASKLIAEALAKEILDNGAKRSK